MMQHTEASKKYSIHCRKNGRSDKIDNLHNTIYTISLHIQCAAYSCFKCCSCYMFNW